MVRVPARERVDTSLRSAIDQRSAINKLGAKFNGKPNVILKFCLTFGRNFLHLHTPNGRYSSVG